MTSERHSGLMGLMNTCPSRLCLLVVLATPLAAAACGAATAVDTTRTQSRTDEQPLASTPDQSPAPGALPAPSAEAVVTVEWSGTKATTGCYFFSGPVSQARQKRLGSQARWTRSGHTVALAFGPDAVFRGSDRDGQVILTRRSSHQERTKWRVEETIVASLGNGILAGRYEYEECDTTGDQGCPGMCTVSSSVTVGNIP